MFKKKFIPVLISAIMLTACASEPVIITQEEYTEISLSWWGNDTRTEYTLEAINEFESLHPNIHIKCSYSEWSGYQTRYNIQMMADTEADVMLVNFSWLEKYSPDGKGYYNIYDLSEYIDLDQFSESELAFGVINDKLNAIPIALNTQTVYYNKTIYDSYGLSLPQTWDDLFNAAKIMGDDVYPIAMPSKSALFYIIAYVEQTSGKTFLPQDDSSGFGVEEFTAMLEFYTTLINGHVMPQVEYFDRNNIRNGTYAGSVAWLSDAENYMGAACDEGYEIVVGDYTGCTNGVEGWYTKPATLYAISAETEHPKEAAMLLDFLLNSDEISELQGIEKGIPLSSSSRNYLQQNDMLGGLAYDAFELMSKNINSMAIIQPFMEDTDMLDAFQEACNAVLYGKASAEEKAAQLYEMCSSQN